MGDELTIVDCNPMKPWKPCAVCISGYTPLLFTHFMLRSTVFACVTIFFSFSQGASFLERRVMHFVRPTLTIVQLGKHFKTKIESVATKTAANDYTVGEEVVLDLAANGLLAKVYNICPIY